MARNTPAMLAMPMAPAPALPVAPVAESDGVPRGHDDLKVPATVTIVLLGLHVVLMALVLPGVSVAWPLNSVLMVATAASVIFWLQRARTTVDGNGYEHQLPKAFGIAGWFIPLGFLYLPVRFVLDVWWARLPQGERGEATGRVLVWWAFWCLAWFTSFRSTPTTTRLPNGDVWHNVSYSLYLGDTLVSCLCLMVAAGALILVVVGISRDDARRP